MTAHEFDDLVARLQAAGTRRNAVKGVVGGTLLSLGGIAAADAKRKTRKQGVDSEHNALSSGKRVACSCTGTETVTCETVKVKSKKLKKILQHPDSHRGPCEEPTTTTVKPTPTTTTTIGTTIIT